MTSPNFCAACGEIHERCACDTPEQSRPMTSPKASGPRCRFCGDALMGGDRCGYNVDCLRFQLAAVTAERDELQRKLGELRDAWAAWCSGSNERAEMAEPILDRYLKGAPDADAS
jgi:hypothetical protein